MNTNTEQPVVSIDANETPVTFMDELQTTLDSGNFIEPNEKMDDDVAKIGIMNDYERALYTLFINYLNEATERRLRLKAELEAEENDGSFEARQKLGRAATYAKAARTLLWASIEDRFAEQYHGAEDATGMSVHTEFYIALKFDSECDSLLDIIGRAISMSGNAPFQE